MVLQRSNVENGVTKFQSLHKYTAKSVKHSEYASNSISDLCVDSNFNIRGSSPVKNELINDLCDNSMSENRLLRHKINVIEMQNRAQQQRLHQLEELVKELHGVISPTSAPSLQQQQAIQKPPCEETHYSGRNGENLGSATDTDELKDTDEVACLDMASLMEEFDRNARENGLVYGVTPSHSIAESDDVVQASETLSSSAVSSSMMSINTETVSSTPSPAFITPTHQNISCKGFESSKCSYNEPETAPQLCFTTPSLLTTEAVREVQAYHQINCSSSSDHNMLSVESTWKNEISNIHVANKVGPFSNLLAGIRQISASQSKQHSITKKSFWPVRNAHCTSSEKKIGGICSPGSSVGNTSEVIRRWSESLGLPFLSPFTESHCGDQLITSDEDFFSDFMFNVAEKTDGEASEDEEFVVDEIVSLSVAGSGDGGKWQCDRSFTSITGPCVSPDLSFDTNRAGDEADPSHRIIKEENILTEIAGDFEGSFLIEEAMLPKDLSTHMIIESVTLEDLNASTCDAVPEQSIPQETSEEKKSGDEQSDHQKGGGEVKLPAGSVILAVVNEAGSLVPYVDVETIPEKTPVLEAGDVDSLLAQFEATEAVNKPESSSSQQEKTKPNDKLKSANEKPKALKSAVPSTSSHRAMPSGGLAQVSPTHQNIKDALPQDFIEKIKASNKRKSTLMLLEPLAVHKGRVVKKQEGTTHHPRGHRSSSKQTKSQKSAKVRIPPPLDHDYCCSTDKQKKGKYGGKCPPTTSTSTSPTSTSTSTTTLSENYVYNKLPDYYTVMTKKNAKKSNLSTSDGNDDGGKKDSGVESGDVSDASVETEERKKEERDKKSLQQQGETIVESSGADSEDIYNKLPAYMTDIGNVIPREEPEGEEGESSREKDAEEKESSNQPEAKKIKRKLNLSEYRQRIQSTQSSRCASPTASHLDSATTLQVAELVEKMENSKCKQKEVEQVPEAKEIEVKPVEEDMEEGELKGDSDPEEDPTKADLSQDSSDKCRVSESVGDSKPNNFPSNPEIHGLPSYNISSNPAPGTTSHWHYSLARTKSRRWSSSRSRSRSRTRSPRRSASHKHRSSRGRRRRKRKVSRSQSPRRSSWRRWSRSHSRSRSHTRSRSRSRGSSYCSSCSSSYSSRSRSHSKSHSSRRRERWAYSRRRSSHERRRSRSGSRSSRYSSSRVTRSRSPIWPLRSHSQLPRHTRPGMNEDRARQVEERRVIYIGRINDDTTKAEVRHRFKRYGDIVDISVHFREYGDNYGFVTYKNREGAYNAVEHGNDDPTLPKYDLCFGGRRAFCKVQYSDLDAQKTEGDYPGGGGGSMASLDFDSLLRAAMKRSTR